MQITTELVKELRDQTGVSVMQCRKALEEAEGDMEKALAILKKSSSDVASKKKDRLANDGSLKIVSDGEKTIMLALHCETDFVSKNEDFVNLLNTLAEKALKEGAEAVKNNSKELIDLVIQKTGENIQLGEIYEIVGSNVGYYVHNGKSAVIVSLEGADQSLAKDIAMHTAAMKPEYITKDEIDQNAKNIMEEIFKKEVEEIEKPEEIKQKMLEGKMNTYFKEKTLVEQPFIKDPSKTIGTLLENAKAKILEIKRYSI